ncbi:MAG: monovalent cation/H(+) antiporter subunit G [Acidobacteriota bacterium]
MDLKLIATGVLLLLGCFFTLTGALGVLRMPDFYSRMHPAAKGDTVGQVLILLALAIYQGPGLVSAKLVLVALLLGITAPTATHAMARAASLSGLKPMSGDGKKSR